MEDAHGTQKKAKSRIRRAPLGEVTDQLVDSRGQVVLGIEGSAALSHVEMQVWTRGASRVADPYDGMSLPDRPALLPPRLQEGGTP